VALTLLAALFLAPWSGCGQLPQTFGNLLGALTPAFVAFLTSVTAVTFFWIGQHLTFLKIQNPPTVAFMWLNNAFLTPVAFIPAASFMVVYYNAKFVSLYIAWQAEQQPHAIGSGLVTADQLEVIRHSLMESIFLYGVAVMAAVIIFDFLWLYTVLTKSYIGDVKKTAWHFGIVTVSLLLACALSMYLTPRGLGLFSKTTPLLLIFLVYAAISVSPTNRALTRDG
jgi:uncharacterized membrane protein